MSMTNVLFVDDEPNIVRAYKRVLRGCGLKVFTTTDTDEAISWAGEHEFAVVVSDQRMPDMEGTELLERIGRIQPDCVRIILTGYADITAAIDAINKGAVWRFLTKPWDDEQLRSTIKAAVQQFNLIEENRRLHVVAESQNERLRVLNEGLELRVEERTREVTELSQRIDETLKGALSVLAHLMEINSATIGNHSRRVADLAKDIGCRMGLKAEDLRQLEVAALLHDIGKLTLPDQILLKDRTRLTGDERRTLQSHTMEGEAIVRAIPYLDDAALFIRHHHERINGSGYPDALKANDIPLGARIVAVADAFDKRFNAKDDFTQQMAGDAVADIADRSNEWYDAGVVAALCDVISRSDESDLAIDHIVELSAEDLTAGMTLARDVLTDSGALLLSSETVLTEGAIARLRTNRSASLLTGIAIHRRRAYDHQGDSFERTSENNAGLQESAAHSSGSVSTV